MPFYTQNLARAARALEHARPWHRSYVRSYASSSGNDPEWLQQLRIQMCRRPIQSTREFVDHKTNTKLISTLSRFLPEEWCRSLPYSGAIVPIGHHLIWFNKQLPPDQLLPDGTDPFTSPGEPWVRRMWAGGSIKMKPADYYHNTRGFAIDSNVVCAERIVNVQLKGQGDAAKLFVDIERRFARQDMLQSNSQGPRSKDPQWSFRIQMLKSDWGPAMLREQRQLVFLKEKTPAELASIKAGELSPVKYLDPPKNPDFSHKLKPTSSLLSLYSTLTFNAHLIHLDREYARNVEGHRNLLVHGPLALTLLLRAMSGYIEAETNGERVVEDIEYRNLAPLYCDEEMRLCGKNKSSSHANHVYDVWIEGPTGGMAFKGTVRTAIKPVTTMVQGGYNYSTHRVLNLNSEVEKDETALHSIARLSLFKLPSTQPKRNTEEHVTEEHDSEKHKREEHDSKNHTTGQHTSSFEPTSNTPPTVDISPETSHTEASTQPKSIVRRVQAVSSPMEPTISFSTQQLLARLSGAARIRKRKIGPKPLVHTHPSEYDYDPDDVASRHSRYRRDGVRTISEPRISRLGSGKTPQYTVKQL